MEPSLGVSSSRSSTLLIVASAASAASMAVLLGMRLRSQRRKQLPLPPGPSGVPVLGSLLAMDPARAHESLDDLSRQYGPLFSYRLGTQLFIAVSDYNLAKEMLSDDNYSGRPQTASFQRQSGGCGLLFSEGDTWRRHRRMALKTLRQFGFAADRSADFVNLQLDDVLAQLQDASVAGTPLEVIDIFIETTSAVIGNMTLGRTFRRGEADLDFLKDATRRLFASRPLTNLPFLFPFTDYFVRLFPASNEINRVNAEILEFIRRQIDERERQLKDEGAVDDAESECLCDVYIKERRRAERDGDHETFKDMQVTRVVLDLLFAGTDTTARSLEWLLIFMAFEPDWQARVQSEIDDVVGSEARARRPTMQDRERLHQTCAVIEESLRLVSLAAVGLFHRAVTDSEFHGYSIPSSALIVPLIYSMNRDPAVWPEPDEFRPERFLDEKNGSFTGPGKNVPFSLGRRVCAGESLARMEIFLVFSAVLQRFRVRVAPDYVDKKADILRGHMGIFRLPGDYRLLFEMR